MKVGIHVASFSWPGAGIASTLADLARAAEDGSISSISAMDHFFQMEGMMGGAEDPMLEGSS